MLYELLLGWDAALQDFAVGKVEITAAVVRKKISVGDGLCWKLEGLRTPIFFFFLFLPRLSCSASTVIFQAEGRDVFDSSHIIDRDSVERSSR